MIPPNHSGQIAQGRDECSLPAKLVETDTMPTVQFANDKTYGKAITFLLYEVGGMFRTKHPRQLVIGPGQIQALQAAGLLPKPKGARKRGKKQS